MTEHDTIAELRKTEMTFKLTLREKAHRQTFSTRPDYDLFLNGQPIGEAYYNMTGYRAVLPTPDGKKLDVGEISLSRLRREIASLNREAKDQKEPTA